MNTLLNSAGVGLRAITALSWKGALLALIVGLAILVIRRRLSPAWRHALWLLVLVRFAVLDLGTSPLSMTRWVALPGAAEPTPTSYLATQPVEPFAGPVETILADSLPATEVAVASTPTQGVDAGTSARFATPWTAWQWLTFVWLSGATLVSGAMVVLHLRMAHRVRRDRVEPSRDAVASLRAVCAIAGVKRLPRLIVTGAVRSPALFGLVRPAILLPRELADLRDPASLHLILLHELAHLQRRDLWSQVAASFILALHWFNPVAWWAARRLRAEAEMAADAWALRRTNANEAHRMGEVLLGLAQHAVTGWMLWFGAATMLGISENKRDLRRRIEALMDVARGRRTWWLMGLAVFSALAVAGLTRAPAQDAKTDAAKATTTTVVGIVVDDAGQPIKGARCSLKIGERDAFEVRKATSDAEGRFRFEGVEVPAKLTLSGRDDEHMDANPKFLNFNSGEQQERRLILPKAVAWVSGTVTRKADGTPVKNADVYVGSQFMMQMVLNFAGRKTTTDEAGHYRIAAGSMEKRDMVLLVDVPEMALAATTFAWREGELTLDQALEPNGGITGTVVNADGQPVSGATVCLADKTLFLKDGAMPPLIAPDGSDYHGNTFCYWFGKPQTDAQGAFSGRSLDARPLRAQRLIAIHPTEGFQYLPLKDWKKGDTIKLERYNTLRGKLVNVDGQAVKGSEIKFSDSKTERDDKGGMVFSILSILSATTDNEGRYQVDRVLPHARDNMISVDGVFNSTTKLNFKSGETLEYNVRLRAKEAKVPSEQLRKITGRVVAPAGTPLRNDDYAVVASISRVGSGKTERLYPDSKGEFATESSEPGDYKIQIFAEPKDQKKFFPAASGGVSMLFKLEPDAKQQALALGDFPLNAADFVLQPPPAVESTIPNFHTRRLNATVPGAPTFTTWAGSAGRGILKEEPVTSDGRMTGATPVDNTQRFIIRGTTADGARYFSAAQTAGLEFSNTIEGTFTFTPGVAVEGRMIGLPADYAGGGWVVAMVMVNGEAKPGALLKGTISTMPWFAWAPVQRDGQFHFTALPRGTVTLAGFVDGWITRDPFNLSTSVRVAIPDSEAVVKVNLDTKPSVTKRLRLMRPDETPAAGARISLAVDVGSNSPVFVRRGHDVEAADAERYALYKKTIIPGHSATTDADGYATLSNQTSGLATYLVQWTDPQTNAVHQETVYVKDNFSPDAAEVIRLTGKNG
jgi:beta-lactamase regulating signal transducer with metallopeptidase domain